MPNPPPLPHRSSGRRRPSHGDRDGIFAHRYRVSVFWPRPAPPPGPFPLSRVWWRRVPPAAPTRASHPAPPRRRSQLAAGRRRCAGHPSPSGPTPSGVATPSSPSAASAGSSCPRRAAPPTRPRASPPCPRPPPLPSPPWGRGAVPRPPGPPAPGRRDPALAPATPPRRPRPHPLLRPVHTSRRMYDSDTLVEEGSERSLARGVGAKDLSALGGSLHSIEDAMSVLLSQGRLASAELLFRSWLLPDSTLARAVSPGAGEGPPRGPAAGPAGAPGRRLTPARRPRPPALPRPPRRTSPWPRSRRGWARRGRAWRRRACTSGRP